MKSTLVRCWWMARLCFHIRSVVGVKIVHILHKFFVLLRNLNFTVCFGLIYWVFVSDSLIDLRLLLPLSPQVLDPNKYHRSHVQQSQWLKLQPLHWRKGAIVCMKAPYTRSLLSRGDLAEQLGLKSLRFWVTSDLVNIYIYQDLTRFSNWVHVCSLRANILYVVVIAAVLSLHLWVPCKVDCILHLYNRMIHVTFTAGKMRLASIPELWGVAVHTGTRICRWRSTRCRQTSRDETWSCR